MGNQASGQCLMADKLITDYKDDFLEAMNHINEEKRFEVSTIPNKIKSDISNFVLIAKGRNFTHSTWEMLGFSVCILYEKDVSFSLWQWATLTNFRSFNFAIVVIDAVTANHITFFLSKSKVFLEKQEFLERLVLCAESSTPTLDGFILDQYETPNSQCLATFPCLKVADVFETITRQQSEVFKSSSHAAFNLYKRSRASISTFQGSDTTQSDLLDDIPVLKKTSPPPTRRKVKRTKAAAPTKPAGTKFVGAKKRRMIKKATKDAARLAGQEPKPVDSPTRKRFKKTETPKTPVEKPRKRPATTGKKKPVKAEETPRRVKTVKKVVRTVKKKTPAKS